MAATGRAHSKNVLVVMRAGCRSTLDWDALIYAFKQVVQPGDKLIILGIIDRIPTLLGCKKAIIEDTFNATNRIALASLKVQLSKEFEAELLPCAEHCDKRQILLEYIIDSGKSFMEVLLHQASQLKPRCIVLDRDLKSQKNNYAHGLACDVLLMKKDGRACKLVTRAHKACT